MSLPLPYGVGVVDPQSPVDWPHPLNRGLVGDWTFLPNSGWRGSKLKNIALGGTRTALDGTLVNSPTWRGNRGRFGGYGSLGFNGSNNYVTTPAISPTNKLTVACWFRTTSTASRQDIIQNTQDSWTIRINQDFNTVQWITNTSGYVTVTASPTISANVWYHVVATYDGTTMVLYLNGQSVGSGAQSGNLQAVTGNVLFGVHSSAATNWFTGDLDGVQIYNVALSTAEVRSLFQETKTGNPDRWRWLLRGAWFPPEQGGGTAYTLNLEAGSYSVTGADLTPLWHQRLNCEAGSYTITGAAATLLANRKLNCEAGSYSITGASATLLASRKLNLESGSYTITGAALTPLWHRRINLEAGSYTITGAAAELVKGGSTTYTLSLDAGSYSITGAALTPLWHRKLNLAAGSYTITGAAMSFATGADPYTDIAGTWAFPEVAGTWSFPEVAGTWEST